MSDQQHTMSAEQHAMSIKLKITNNFKNTDCSILANCVFIIYICQQSYIFSTHHLFRALSIFYSMLFGVWLTLYPLVISSYQFLFMLQIYVFFYIFSFFLCFFF